MIIQFWFIKIFSNDISNCESLLYHLACNWEYVFIYIWRLRMRDYDIKYYMLNIFYFIWTFKSQDMSETEKNAFELCKLQIASSRFTEETRKISIMISIFIIMIGLIGNSLGFVLLMQKKSRSKSVNIYLLSLFTSDSFYLITHFFEDTLKSNIEHYIHKTDYVHEKCLMFKNLSISYENADHESFVSLINIIDKFDFFCKSINFARNFLRFISAYIIVAFTIQRTRVIRQPFLQKSLESRKKIRFILSAICVFATLSAFWIPLMLHSTHFESSNYLTECYIRDGYHDLYFLITNIYVVFIILIPMVIISVCNTITIYFMKKSTKKLKYLANLNNLSKDASELTQMISKKSTNIFVHNQNAKSKKAKTNIILLMISSSYVLLDLPYFISWLFLFCQEKYNILEDEKFDSIIDHSIYSNYIIGIINLTEVFYLLNFSIHFYIYVLTTKQFGHQFNNMFKCKWWKLPVKYI